MIFLFPCHCVKLTANSEDFITEQVNLGDRKNISSGTMEGKKAQDILSLLIILSGPGL